jgi:hypothetical protein
MSKKLVWNRLHGSVLAIAAITLIGIGLVAVGSHAVAANPALTPFNFKVKECKVDTNPNPVSCKGLKKMINGDTFDLQVSRDNGKIVITLNPTESVRTP